MVSLGLRRPITSAVLDLTTAHDLPNPDVLAEAYAKAQGMNAVFSRIACVVHTPQQERFATMLKSMATRPNDIGVVFAEEAALRWLGIDPDRP